MILDINNIKNGLYRIKTNNNFRFFRIYQNQEKKIKIKEFKDGDLHKVINVYEGEDAKSFLNSIENLEFWQ